jgi:hypothetical protein
MATLTASSTMIVGQMTTDTNITKIPQYANNTMIYGQMTTDTNIIKIPQYANNTMIYGQMTTITDIIVPFQASIYKNGNWN